MLRCQRSITSQYMSPFPTDIAPFDPSTVDTMPDTFTVEALEFFFTTSSFLPLAYHERRNMETTLSRWIDCVKTPTMMHVIRMVEADHCTYSWSSNLSQYIVLRESRTTTNHFHPLKVHTRANAKMIPTDFKHRHCWTRDKLKYIANVTNVFPIVKNLSRKKKTSYYITHNNSW